MEIAPDVSRHLDRFRDGLPAVAELRGLYLYGSLTTGDFSPASSDIDVLAVTERRPVGTVLDCLRALHLDLARAGGPYARLNCLYVPDGTLTAPDRLHTYLVRGPLHRVAAQGDDRSRTQACRSGSTRALATARAPRGQPRRAPRARARRASELLATADVPHSSFHALAAPASAVRHQLERVWHRIDLVAGRAVGQYALGRPGQVMR